MTRIPPSLAAAAIALSMIASPASATATCASTDVFPNATALPGSQDCVGFYDRNVLTTNPDDIAIQQAALALLGFNWDGNFTDVEVVDSLSGAPTLHFMRPLGNGDTFLAINYDDVPGAPGDATAFYHLRDVRDNKILLNFAGSSNAILYWTGNAVPEPATWALMLAGFATLGGAIRRRAIRVGSASKTRC